MWVKDTSLGQRLKFVRKYRCMTQKELGILLGYPENQADIRIAQYENNSRKPKTKTIEKMASVLDVSTAVFSTTICSSREDLLQSLFWLYLAKGGGVIYDCESEFAQRRMKLKIEMTSFDEFIEGIFKD